MRTSFDLPASKIPRNAVEQRLYTRPMPGGVNLEATIAFLMVDGTIEVLRVDPVTGKATRTAPWTPSEEWEIKSIIDLSSGDVLDPKTRSVVGRAIMGAVKSSRMSSAQESTRSASSGEAKPS